MREALRAARSRVAAARAGGGDGGFTLVELLITMVVFSIAVGMVYTALIQTQVVVRDVEGSADANFELRTALADIDKQVRSGNVLYSPANEVAVLSSCTAVGTNAGTCMRIYTQANGANRCVQWQVLADAAEPGTSLLRVRSWSPDWQTDGQVTGWATKARGLEEAPSQAPFALSGSSTSYGSRLVDIRFEADDPRRSAPSVISASLSGRNTNYGYDAGLCSPAPPA